MPIHPDFPADPYAILSPDVRWYPGDALLGDMLRGQLIPPLVEKVRRGVTDWRASGYAGASETTRALLKWWFEREHFFPTSAASFNHSDGISHNVKRWKARCGCMKWRRRAIRSA